MLLLFFLFLPCAVCLVALPSLAMKLRKLPSDYILIAVCISAFLYFFTSVYRDIQWLVYMGWVMGAITLPLIYLWEGNVNFSVTGQTTSLRFPTFHTPLIFSHYNNQEWSARDQYLVRADIAVMVGVVFEITKGILLYFEWMIPQVLALIALLQAAALYIFYSSTIYLAIIDNPAINRDTLRAVQQARQSQLRDGFELLMGEQKPFLKQGITIEDISLMLGTNRTYLSRMLHDDYACSFPEYINEKRLEYSQTFLLEHPHEVQEEVAFQCGFANASAYNKKFKDKYGMTPREWLIVNRRDS